MTSLFRDRGAGTDLVRMVLDDETMARLRQEAMERDIPLEELLSLLLAAASTRVDDLLGQRLHREV